MKKLLPILLLGCGCQNSTIQMPDGSQIKRWSMLYPLKVQSLDFKTTSTNGAKGELKASGYVSDQAQMLGAATEAAVKAAINGVVK